MTAPDAPHSEDNLTRRCAELAAQTLHLEAEVSRLRRENVALGDRNVLLVTEWGAALDVCETALGPWLPVTKLYLPEHLHGYRDVLDTGIEAIATNELAQALSMSAVEPHSNEELRQVTA